MKSSSRYWSLVQGYGQGDPQWIPMDFHSPLVLINRNIYGSSVFRSHPKTFLKMLLELTVLHRDYQLLFRPTTRSTSSGDGSRNSYRPLKARKIAHVQCSQPIPMGIYGDHIIMGEQIIRPGYRSRPNELYIWHSILEGCNPVSGPIFLKWTPWGNVLGKSHLQGKPVLSTACRRSMPRHATRTRRWQAHAAVGVIPMEKHGKTERLP